MVEITEKQKKFCDEYIISCNAREAYKKIYSSCKKETAIDASASRLLSNAKIIEYIKSKKIPIDKATIASMEEVREFWSNTMRSESNEPKDRLKASELIAKSNGAFLEKVEHSGGIEFVITKVRK